MTKNVYVIKKPFQSGISKPIRFAVETEDGVGFKPSPLMISGQIPRPQAS
jgi:hypothetical protein